jgi:hypothetical protein
VDLVLYGIPLTGFVLAIVKVLQEKAGVDDEAAGWVRAGLLGGGFLLVVNADAIQAMWPLFKTVVVQGAGFLTVVLGSLGYWPEIQAIGRRIIGK